MKTNSWYKIMFLLLGALMISQSSELLAQRRRDEVRVRGGARVVVNLPHERTRVLVEGREYFYSRGLFYRSGPRGYLVMRGPIGARVRVLPAGYATLRIGGGPFFFYYGTYYRFDPMRRDYVVVPPPPGAPAPQALDRINLADGKALEGTFIGGTKSTVQIEVNGEVQEIPIDQIVSIEFAPPGEE